MMIRTIDKRLLRNVAAATLLLSALHAAPAQAAACPSYTTLTNGTTADATKVMDNFNYILQCPNFTDKVGIGISPATAKLDLGSTVGNQPSLRLHPGSATGVAYSGYLHNDLLIGSYTASGYSHHYISFGYPQDPERKFHIGAASNGSFNGTTSFSPKLTVTSGGNVGIGTTSPSYLLQVNGTAYATGAAGALSDIRHKKEIAPLKDGALADVMSPGSPGRSSVPSARRTAVLTQC
jgi:hypothetical protein